MVAGAAKTGTDRIELYTEGYAKEFLSVYNSILSVPAFCAAAKYGLMALCLSAERNSFAYPSVYNSILLILMLKWSQALQKQVPTGLNYTPKDMQKNFFRCIIQSCRYLLFVLQRNMVLWHFAYPRKEILLHILRC